MVPFEKKEYVRYDAGSRETKNEGVILKHICVEPGYIISFHPYVRSHATFCLATWFIFCSFLVFSLVIILLTFFVYFFVLVFICLVDKNTYTLVLYSIRIQYSNIFTIPPTYIRRIVFETSNV